MTQHLLADAEDAIEQRDLVGARERLSAFEARARVRKPDPARVARLWWQLGELGLRAGDRVEALAAYERSESWFDRADDVDGLVACWSKQSLVMLDLDDLQGAAGPLGRARGCDRDPTVSLHPATRLRVRLAETELRQRVGDRGGAVEMAREAVAMADAGGDPVLGVKAWQALAVALGRSEDPGAPRTGTRHDAVSAVLEALRRRDEVLEDLRTQTGRHEGLGPGELVEGTAALEHLAWTLAHRSEDGRAALQVSEATRVAVRPGSAEGGCRWRVPTGAHVLEYTTWPEGGPHDEPTSWLGIVWSAPGREPLSYHLQVPPRVLDALDRLARLRSTDPWDAALRVRRGERLLDALGLLLLPAPLRAELGAGDGTARLVVVPTGVLWSLPWPALGVSDDGRRLVEVAEVSVLPSLAYASDVGLERPLARPLLLEDAGISGQEVELQTLSMVGGPVRRVADRDDFLAGLAEASIAVVSSHGFDPGSHEHTIDLPSGQQLVAADLRTLTHLPEVLVLGSCYAGRVAFDGPHRPSGFVVDALAGGARAVIAPIWATPGSGAARVLSDTYRWLAAGVAPQTALRRAQTRAIADGLPVLQWAGLLAFSSCPGGRDGLLPASPPPTAVDLATHHALRASSQLEGAEEVGGQLLDLERGGGRSDEHLGPALALLEIDARLELAGRDLARAREHLPPTWAAEADRRAAAVVHNASEQSTALAELRRALGRLVEGEGDLISLWPELDRAQHRAADTRNLVLQLVDPDPVPGPGGRGQTTRDDWIE